ncbi:MAG: hypothetical protein QOE70_218 [Chthoniobacter sp.]|nr:hypothetical protein [Chthoniobacter sp.]
MWVSTLSSKNQTTVNADLVRLLGLRPGTRLRQWVEDNCIVLAPVEDIDTAYGAFVSKHKAAESFEQERKLMQKSVGEQVVAGMAVSD